MIQRIKTLFKVPNKEISELIPIKRYDNEAVAFERTDGKYFDLLKIKTKNLTSISETDGELFESVLALFYNTYQWAFKIVALNFPINTQKQRDYLKEKLQQTNNPVFKDALKKEIQLAQNVQDNQESREYYLLFFGNNKEDIQERRKSIFSTLARSTIETHVVDVKTSYEMKVNVLYKLFNLCAVKYGKVDVENHTEATEEEIKKYGYDPYLMETIAPEGNISFSHDARYAMMGDGYLGCLEFHDYPRESLSQNWLYVLTNHARTKANVNGTAVILDITTIDADTVVKNINKGIKEYGDQATRMKKATVRLDADTQQQQLVKLFQESAQMKNAIKAMRVRMFVGNKTYDGLDKEISEIQKSLGNSESFVSSVYVNELEAQYKSILQSYVEQEKLPNKREGQALPSDTLAYGNPFHYTELKDPCGAFYGFTDTLGAVFFDLFNKTELRTAYNMFVAGLMGSGKSTLLKFMLYSEAIKGNFIRGVDSSDSHEYKPLIDALGGLWIEITDEHDGTKLNPMDIIEARETQKECFVTQLSKLETMYHFLSPSSDKRERDFFQSLCSMAYAEKGLISFDEKAQVIVDKKITGLEPTAYPLFSDVLEITQSEIKGFKQTGDVVQDKLLQDRISILGRIEEILEKIVTTHGNIFNGYSTVSNLQKEQVVFFDISGLTSKTEDIFDAQFYNIISFQWDNCTSIGKGQKQLFDERKIETKDATKFIVFFDEAHKIINEKKPYALDYISLFMREARKYFGSLIFASQALEDFVSASVDGKAEMSSSMAKLFGLAQYKVLLRLDQSSANLIKATLGISLTERDIASIPTLEVGKMFLSTGGNETIGFKLKVSKEKLRLFSGGA